MPKPKPVLKPTAIKSFSGKYEWLSNSFPNPVTLSGITFPSNEHAYHALKSDFTDVAKEFADSALPADQVFKKGQEVELRADWEDIKVRWMYLINRAKFSGNEELKQKLLATENMNLINKNDHGDQIWGISEGKGENLLGKILVLIRSELRSLK